MAAESHVPAALIAAFGDRYELIREIGHGGSATVYLARDSRHERDVAIKVLHHDVHKTSGERFLREIRVSAKMQHPHVLPTYDSGVVDGRMYFVMPFVDGGSLRDRLTVRKSLPVAEALQIARQVAVALSHAHGLGIIHRDVKPENIMFYHGVACLADFGIARPLEEIEPGVTMHGTIVGTPGYMSPEQFLTGFDGRSDIYSLCCVLYEMLAGTRLFSGTTPQELVERRSYHLAKNRDAGPALPDYVDRILDRGLARAPHHRFNDATEFVAVLDDALLATEKPRRRISAERALVSLWHRKIEVALAAIAVAMLAVALWPRWREGAARQRVMLQGAPAPVSDTPFETGKSAMDAWDIPRAENELVAAVARDPNNVNARLWLAETQLLARHSGREDFRVGARQIEPFLGKLRGRDSLLAEGALALATGRPVDACRAYRTQLHRDTLDVLAWYGLGDCHSLDTAVVADKRSASGWRFNSSYEAAARAYRRVVELAPASRAAVPFSLMTRLLPVNPASIRRGRAVTGGQTFFAYPALSGDTVAFTPQPMTLFQSVAPATISPTQAQALDRNRDILLRFAEEWVGSSRESADAWEALAFTREIRGELMPGTGGAAAALANARALARDEAQQLRLAASEVRLHVKEGDFKAARAEVDSIFKANGHEALDMESADLLSGLAALTGRAAQMAELQVTAKSTQYVNVGVAPPLAAAGARLFARAAFGVCDDSVKILRRELEKTLESYSTPARRATARQVIVWQAAGLSFPCAGAEAFTNLDPTSPLDRAQRAFAAGSHSQARAILDSVAAIRAGSRPGDVALDFTVQEAWLRAATGDSAAAERQLDLVLDALPTLSARTSVLEGAQSAAVGRAMALRADLAINRGDTLTAKRWAKNVVELWKSADPALKPTIDRMKSIAR